MSPYFQLCPGYSRWRLTGGAPPEINTTVLVSVAITLGEGGMGAKNLPPNERTARARGVLA